MRGTRCLMINRNVFPFFFPPNRLWIEGRNEPYRKALPFPLLHSPLCGCVTLSVREYNMITRAAPRHANELERESRRDRAPSPGSGGESNEVATLFKCNSEQPAGAH